MEPTVLLDRARELVPVLRSRAAESEERRTIPTESVKQISEAGLLRVIQPKCWGGYEMDPRVFLEIGEILASGCASTGWIYSVMGVHQWQLGLMDEQAQRDVWGDDDTVLMSSSYAPRGKVEPVEGGYRLSGRWSFSSGCEFAQWAIVGGLLPQPDGTTRAGSFLVPLGDYEVEDVWHVMGLKGTGSNDLVISDAFVPEHRVHMFTTGSPVSTDPLFSVPFTALFGYSLTAPIIGMAQGALDEHIRWTRERVRITAGNKVANEGFSQVRVAEASGKIDAARAQMRANMGDLLAAGAAGEVPFELRARARRDQVRGTREAVEAIDLVFSNSGASAIKNDSAIQRFWRDAHAGQVHNSNVPEPILAGYGRFQFGLPVDGIPF